MKAKRKEIEVKEYLDVNNFAYDTHDKTIDGGKHGKERPDFLFRETHALILEVDEYQHSANPPERERIRMINISRYLGCKLCLFATIPTSMFLRKVLIK